MLRKSSGETSLSAVKHHRFDSHKTLNLMLSLDKTNKDKNYQNIDRSFCLYKSNQISNKSNNKLSQKSNFNKDFLTTKDNDNYSNKTHIGFGQSLSKVFEKKNKLEQSHTQNDYKLKKAQSNYITNTNSSNKIFDFEDSETTTNKKENDLIIDPSKFKRSDRRYNTTFKKGIFVRKKDDNDNDINIKIEKKRPRKRTIDYGSRNHPNIRINNLDSTMNYIKLNKATSAAGKDSGRTKTNQDSYINEKNINGIMGFSIFGVLDGHGVNGHFSSQFVKKYILNTVKNHPIVKNSAKPKDIYQHLIANNYKAIAKIFIDADMEIRKQNFNCENSGTTCVIVFQLDEHLICANAGDSRAILIYDEKNDERLRTTKVYPLSFDCKPQNPTEKKRITDKGGVVKQDIDEDGNPEGPFRVYLKGENWPGIAISRSIGDSDAKTIGVIPNPQIVEYTLNPKSKYMMICSDGIWEYISNDEAMNIGNKYYLKNDAYGLCNDLTKTSTNIWNNEDLDGDVDDITVVVAFF